MNAVSRMIISVTWIFAIIFAEEPREGRYPMFIAVDLTGEKSVYDKVDFAEELYRLALEPVRFAAPRPKESASSAWMIMSAENHRRRILAYPPGNEIGKRMTHISGTMAFIADHQGARSNVTMRMELDDFIHPVRNDRGRNAYKAIFDMPEVIHGWFAFPGTALFAIDRKELDQWISSTTGEIRTLPGARLHAVLPEMDWATAGRILNILSATTPEQLAPFINTLPHQGPLERLFIANRAIRCGTAAQVAACAQDLLKIPQEYDRTFVALRWRMANDGLAESATTSRTTSP